MTAVEWLVNKILTEVDKYDDEGNINGLEYWNSFIGATDLSGYVNKAKEMERQQIIDSYDVSWDANIKDGKDYYNQKFKK
jgi:hypothetical protein